MNKPEANEQIDEVAGPSGKTYIIEFEAVWDDKSEDTCVYWFRSTTAV
jgi:hypothetical protein